MMNLEEFVSLSLIQIVNGMIKADEALEACGAAVNPLEVAYTDKHKPAAQYAKGKSESGRYPIIEKVEFDVVVRATTESETKGGIGIAVGAINLGNLGQSGSQDSSESRIKFSVPVLMPNSKHA